MAYSRGDYRLVYEIDDTAKRVDVARIAHRREVYEESQLGSLYFPSGYLPNTRRKSAISPGAWSVNTELTLLARN